MSNFLEELKGRQARVLLYGHINLNVIDGSAFFLTALADVLSADPLIRVDLALAVPLTRTLVIEDFLGRDNVSLLDPFEDLEEGPLRARARMSPDRAAAFLAAQMEAREHDIAFIRSTEVVAHLATLASHLMPRVVLYVTGIVSPSVPVPEDTVVDLRRIVATGGRLACQTPEMADHLTLVLDGRTGSGGVVVMPPVVRADDDDHVPAPPATGGNTRFVYTGKFFRDWIPQKIIAGFKRARLTRPSMSLDVAGDSFREDPENPEFVPLTRYLLRDTEGLTWHGGITREASRALIKSCDVGVSWRSGNLDDSLELSTKLLEFGALGKPCIMNRTPMHERLFGTDYPLFVDSMEDFVATLRVCADDPSTVARAAARAFAVSMEYTTEMALARLIELFPASDEKFPEPHEGHVTTIHLLEANGGYGDVVRALLGQRLTAYRFTGPSLEMHVSRDFQAGQDLSMDLIRTLFERQCRMTHLRRPTPAEQGIELDLPRGATPGASLATRELSVANNQKREILGLQTELRKRNHTIAELARSSQGLRGELAARERSLGALSGSKLGKLQLAYWKLRKGRRP